MNVETAVATNQSSWEPPIPLDQVSLPSFPVDTLPEWMRDFVEAEAEATQTPADLSAMIALAAAGFAASKRAVVRVKPGHEEPLNLYTVVALPPANRKSAVFRDAAEPIAAAEAAEVSIRQGEIADSESRYRVGEEELKRLEREAANCKTVDKETLKEKAAAFAGELASWERPVSPRYIAEDCSPERLATLLRDQGGRLAVMAPEGDIFDLMAGRYSGNGVSNFGVFLKAHAGDDLRVDRVNRAAEFVKKPALTIGLAVQPEVLRGLAQRPGFRGKGLLARFLYAIPPSPLGSRVVDPPAVTDAVREAYHGGMLRLLALKATVNEWGEEVPRAITLDPDALAQLRDFERWIEPQLGEFGTLAHISDWAGKLVGAVLRIVGIVCLGEDSEIPASGSFQINGSQMERAIRIGYYLIPHARAAFGEMGADPVLADANHVVRWVLHSESRWFSKRDAYKALKGRFPTVMSIEPSLTLLLDHGFVRLRAQERISSPGRPASPVYDVNPHVRGHNPHNPQNRLQAESFGDSGNCGDELFERNGRARDTESPGIGR